MIDINDRIFQKLSNRFLEKEEIDNLTFSLFLDCFRLDMSHQSIDEVDPFFLLILAEQMLYRYIRKIDIELGISIATASPTYLEYLELCQTDDGKAYVEKNYFL